MNFDEAFDRLLGHEGGYVNDPSDPGGETNWGISKRAYPDIVIKALTRDQAKKIYKLDFWDRLDGDFLPPGLAFQVFDFAVNSGITTAVRYLQRACGVADDGYWGPISQAAVQSQPESDLVMRLNAERLEFMSKLAGWQVYSRGWVRRVAKNLRYGAYDSQDKVQHGQT